MQQKKFLSLPYSRVYRHTVVFDLENTCTVVDLIMKIVVLRDDMVCHLAIMSVHPVQRPVSLVTRIILL
jgi:hypothetical protein